MREKQNLSQTSLGPLANLTTLKITAFDVLEDVFLETVVLSADSVRNFHVDTLASDDSTSVLLNQTEPWYHKNKILFSSPLKPSLERS